jgi:hypothetical protein
MTRRRPSPTVIFAESEPQSQVGYGKGDCENAERKTKCPLIHKPSVFGKAPQLS